MLLLQKLLLVSSLDSRVNVVCSLALRDFEYTFELGQLKTPACVYRHIQHRDTKIDIILFILHPLIIILKNLNLIL